MRNAVANANEEVPSIGYCLVGQVICLVQGISNKVRAGLGADGDDSAAMISLQF